MVCLPEEPDWWEMASSKMMGRHLVLVMFITTSLHSGTPVPENVICGVTRGAPGKRKETTTISHSLGFGVGRVKSSAGVWEGRAFFPLEGQVTLCFLWRDYTQKGKEHFCLQPLASVCKPEGPGCSPVGLRGFLIFCLLPCWAHFHSSEAKVIKFCRIQLYDLL